MLNNYSSQSKMQHLQNVKSLIYIHYKFQQEINNRRLVMK
jgi:hypothetical protein